MVFLQYTVAATVGVEAAFCEYPYSVVDGRVCVYVCMYGCLCFSKSWFDFQPVVQCGSEGSGYESLVNRLHGVMADGQSL